MKFLRRKSERAEPDIDQAALAERLRSVAGRGKDETALYPARPEPRPADGPRIKRLFWAPDELE